MMGVQFKPLETTIRRAPLGLAFLDLARATTVTGGLEVRTWQLGSRGPIKIGSRSPLSGIYGFRSLPGLRPFEIGERAASDWCPSPPDSSPPVAADDLPDMGDLLQDGRPPNFVVMVEDRDGRFLPMVMLMCLPKERLIEVPLFSGPARPTPAGQAVLRGQVWDRQAGAPAAWALIAAQTETDNGPAPSYAGLADEKGIFALFMPYANPPAPPVGSPPHGTVDIDELTWTVIIEVYYEPNRLQPLARPEGVRGPLPPDIRSILYQQPALVFDQPGTSGATLARALRFGQELIVSTQDLLPPQQSRLLVDPT